MYQGKVDKRSNQIETQFHIIFAKNVLA